MATHSRKLSLILLVCLAGCNRDRAQQPLRTDSAAHHPADSVTVERPVNISTLAPQKEDTIRVEGDLQKVILKRVQPSSTLPFYTYMPADMIAETRADSLGEAHYFFANFAGKRNDSAFLLLYVFRRATPKDRAVAAAKAFRESHKSKDFASYLDVRMHNQRFYYIALYYPHEYGDGFAPRAKRILDEWQWLDTTSQPRRE